MVSIHPTFFTHAPSAVRMQSVCVSAKAAQKRLQSAPDPRLFTTKTYLSIISISNPNVVSL